MSKEVVHTKFNIGDRIGYNEISKYGIRQNPLTGNVTRVVVTVKYRWKPDEWIEKGVPHSLIVDEDSVGRKK